MFFVFLIYKMVINNSFLEGLLSFAVKLLRRVAGIKFLQVFSFHFLLESFLYYLAFTSTPSVWMLLSSSLVMFTVLNPMTNTQPSSYWVHRQHFTPMLAFSYLIYLFISPSWYQYLLGFLFLFFPLLHTCSILILVVLS